MAVHLQQGEPHVEGHVAADQPDLGAGGDEQVGLVPRLPQLDEDTHYYLVTLLNVTLR